MLLLTVMNHLKKNPLQVDACQKEQKKQKFTISLDMHQILKVAYML